MSCEEGKLQLNKKRHFKVKRLEEGRKQKTEFHNTQEICTATRALFVNKQRNMMTQKHKSGVYGIMYKSNDSHLKNDSLFQNIFIKYEAQRTRKQRMICKILQRIFCMIEELMYP